MAKQVILQQVKDALQEAEEMGGVEDKKEYVQLMTEVILECTSRINNCVQDGGIP